MEGGIVSMYRVYTHGVFVFHVLSFNSSIGPPTHCRTHTHSHRENFSLCGYERVSRVKYTVENFVSVAPADQHRESIGVTQCQTPVENVFFVFSRRQTKFYRRLYNDDDE